MKDGYPGWIAGGDRRDDRLTACRDASLARWMNGHQEDWKE